MHLIFNYYYCIPAIFISVLDSGGAGSARAPPEFGGLEKRTEREIDNLLLQAPLDLKRYTALINDPSNRFPMIKLIYSEKSTKFWEISTLLLTGTT